MLTHNFNDVKLLVSNHNWRHFNASARVDEWKKMRLFLIPVSFGIAKMKIEFNAMKEIKAWLFGMKNIRKMVFPGQGSHINPQCAHCCALKTFSQSVSHG